MSGAHISIKEVSKGYKKGAERVAVLNHLTLAIASGEFVSLMGPSGSGKTTLLNLIAGLDTPDSGEISIGGARIDSLRQRKLDVWRSTNVGIVFQFYNLMPVLTAQQNVELPLLLTSLTKRERHERSMTALDLVGLADRGDHKPAQLSGGQQQRVSIARAIVADPPLLVCDEPTGDLDKVASEAILNLLATLNSGLSKTIVMVTHDPRAAQFASRQLHMDKGSLATEVEKAA